MAALTRDPAGFETGLWIKNLLGTICPELCANQTTS